MDFSEREGRVPPRDVTSISQAVWGGFVGYVNGKLAEAAFGVDFPKLCPDEGSAICGCDEGAFSLALRGEFPGLRWPLDPSEPPDTLTILDLFEFGHRHIGQVVSVGVHSFYDHRHLMFQRAEGREAFREWANRIFRRNGLAFEMTEEGSIRRLPGPVLDAVVAALTFKTGDQELDELLEVARARFLSPDASVRRDGLEKLWDAWERLKSLEFAEDKRESTKRLLDRVAGEAGMRSLLEEEAKALTRIGNDFRIRHHETSKTAVTRDEHVDYLFLRLFVLIRLLLGRSTA